LIVDEGNPLSTPLARTGLFVVQDEASQLVGVAAAAVPGERILDACAAPGGKTTSMAADLRDRGLVVAADVRSRRLRLLTETVRASGARSVRIVHANAAEAMPFQPLFDCVLIDAPCSGLGTLRRDPDIKWRRAESEFPALADLQLRMLTLAAAVVRPGGRLVYATCSSEPEENEQIVSAFLESHPDFVPKNLRLASAPELINEAGHLRTLPFRDGLEAFFAASVVKAGNLR
jgi:16S rRNA (cytosine967-C5)-methyltransferase